MKSPKVSQYLVHCHLTMGPWGVPMAIVTMHAFACDYEHLRYAVMLKLCMHKHVTVHIHAMQSASSYYMCM